MLRTDEYAIVATTYTTVSHLYLSPTPVMVVTRKEKETNQQVLRRFNRIMQGLKVFQDVREKKEFKREPNRFAIRTSALRRDSLRKARQWY